MMQLIDLVSVLSELSGKIQGDVTMEIAHRANRNAKPIQLSSAARSLVPPAVLKAYAETEVAMFRVKQNDKHTYMIDIMLEG
jgi:hypothetical protein